MADPRSPLDAAAKALYQERWGGADWALTADMTRENYRIMARACIEAAVAALPTLEDGDTEIQYSAIITSLVKPRQLLKVLLGDAP